MRRVIRRGTFETNSPSMHTLILLTEKAYDEWMDSGGYIYPGGVWDEAKIVDKVYTFDEVKDLIVNKDEYYDEDQFLEDYEEEGDYWLAGEWDCYTAQAWYEDDLETEETVFKMSDGDNIVAACKYGWR